MFVVAVTNTGIEMFVAEIDNDKDGCREHGDRYEHEQNLEKRVGVVHVVGK